MKETTVKFLYSFEGLPNFYTHMTFTDAEVSYIKDILNKFDAVSVEKFTAELEHICREQIRILSRPKQTKSDIEQDITDLLKTCKKTARELQKIAEVKKILIPTDNFNFTINAESGEADLIGWPGQAWWSKIMSQAIPATTELLKFIECVEARPQAAKIKTGRPPTEPKGFVTEIWNLYKSCFKTLAKKNSTEFQSTVLFALEGTGHKYKKDASRKIRNALPKT
ncbi:MAG: hypothetical protein HIU83_14985 [Proteobacteria bacterium]|nr:hypothetical protein [Pseudomonadota bacterium]